MVVPSLTWVWLLFYSLRHLTRTPEMDNYVSTELKQPNPGCYLSMWKSLKLRTNSLKLYLLVFQYRVSQLFLEGPSENCSLISFTVNFPSICQ